MLLHNYHTDLWTWLLTYTVNSPPPTSAYLCLSILPKRNQIFLTCSTCFYEKRSKMPSLTTPAYFLQLHLRLLANIFWAWARHLVHPTWMCHELSLHVLWPGHPWANMFPFLRNPGKSTQQSKLSLTLHGTFSPPSVHYTLCKDLCYSTLHIFWNL